MLTSHFIFTRQIEQTRLSPVGSITRSITRPNIRKISGDAMRWLIVASLLLLVSAGVSSVKEEKKVDDEFAEFEEEFEFVSSPEENTPSRKEDKSGASKPSSAETQDEEGVDDLQEEEQEEEGDDEDVTVENTYDTDEFEVISSEQQNKPTISSKDNLEISESTVKMLPFWRMYFGELCIGAALSLYILNYLFGRTRNSQIAQSWLTNQMSILKHNFTIVGDDGEGDEPTDAHLVKRADHSYVVWSSGRAGCDGLLVHLELQKRHDLYSVISSIFRPSPDTVSFIFQLSQQDMEGIVFALAPRKTALKMHKDYEDLSKYCPPPRPVDRFGLPNLWSMVVEAHEAASSLLTPLMVKFLVQHSSRLVSIHVSDQYTGLKDDSSDDSDTVVVKNPERRIHITFTLPSNSNENSELLQFSIMMLEHFRSIRFSREVREKAMKNRSKVAQGLEKLQHQQRQEAAQQRREDKKKAEKEKMLNEPDADKTRKWEEKERKKQMKKSQPRMKQMKVRG